MPKEVTTFLGTILTISDWNAGCGKLGTSMSLPKKALTKYGDEHQGNSTDHSLDERHLPDTASNTNEMAPN